MATTSVAISSYCLFSAVILHVLPRSPLRVKALTLAPTQDSQLVHQSPAQRKKGLPIGTEGRMSYPSPTCSSPTVLPKLSICDQNKRRVIHFFNLFHVFNRFSWASPSQYPSPSCTWTPQIVCPHTEVASTIRRNLRNQQRHEHDK